MIVTECKCWEEPNLSKNGLPVNLCGVCEANIRTQFQSVIQRAIGPWADALCDRWCPECGRHTAYTD